MTSDNIYGGLEGGGTKFVCMVGSSPQNILEEVRFPTTIPRETIQQAVNFFKRCADNTRLSAIGVASFGPLDLDKNSPTYGHITTTPKPGWSHTDMISKLHQALGIPIIFEHDVSASAFGEYYWNPQNRQKEPLVYFTIGTGIGAGIILNSRPVHGLLHIEAGHMHIPHDRKADPYSGNCPFHSDCFEGLACGPAMKQRWGQPAENLPEDHPAWNLEATYIALAMSNVIFTLSPKRIVLGGGVMQHEALFPMIRQKVLKLLNNYIQSSDILERIDDFIVPPFLGNRSGVLGAIALARVEIEEKKKN